MSRRTALSRYGAACSIPFVAFAVGAFGDDAAPLAVVFLLLVFGVFLRQASGSGASWMEVDSQTLAAHFALRPSERIPLARVAAVAVERSLRWTGDILPDSFSTITVFRADEPSVVRIRAETVEADAFLFALARNAKLSGLSRVAPFAIPRRHYVHDLLPLLPAIAIVLAFPLRVSWASFALAVVVFVAWTALSWRRFARLAEAIATGEVRPELKTWGELLRVA